MSALVTWRWGLFLTAGKIGVVSVSSLFLTRVGVYVGMVCVYAHTHPHCTHGILGCELRVRDETPGRPKESKWTKSRHICIRICVQSTFICICQEAG